MFIHIDILKVEGLFEQTKFIKKDFSEKNKKNSHADRFLSGKLKDSFSIFYY
jgi:hypothetical protein